MMKKNWMTQLKTLQKKKAKDKNKRLKEKWQLFFK